MDNKILLQQLAESLSERTGITKRKAEAFVRSFFEVTEEGLQADGIVKVKNFGTTKIVSVGDRESVNIKTGERFQIEGHDKITFTPDALFKDLVNRPFAHFSTTILADDFDEAELDSLATSPATPDEETETENIIDELTTAPVAEEENIVIETTDSPVLTVNVNDNDNDNDDDNDDGALRYDNKNDDPSTSSGQAHALRNDDDDDNDDEGGDTIVVIPAPNEPSASDSSQEGENTQHVVKLQNIIIKNNIPMQPTYKVWHLAVYALCTLLLMILSYGAGYYRIFGSDEQPAFAEQTQAKEIAQKPQPTTPKVTSQTSQAKPDTTVTPAATPTPSEKQTTTDTPVTPSQQQTPKPAPAPSAAKNFKQMEGGEYLIVGVLEQHKMEVGDNLYKLARKAYGDKALVKYIIFHNNLSNPDVVQLGQTIEIPKLQKR